MEVDVLLSHGQKEIIARYAQKFNDWKKTEMRSKQSVSTATMNLELAKLAKPTLIVTGTDNNMY